MLGSRRRKGLTLVELLLTVAILSILLAALLPAVMVARQAARRADCQNNLRQLGTALHVYHGARRSFPAGSVNDWSWNARLLPYLEARALYDRYDLKRNPFEPPNFSQLAERLPVMLCSSDPNSEEIHSAVLFGGAEFGHTNYLGSLDAGTSRVPRR